MKHKILLLFVVFFGSIMVFVSCMNNLKSDEFTDSAISEEITVRVKMPENYNYPVSGLTVTLTDNAAGLKYTGITNEQGVVEIKVAPGFYTAMTETSFRDSGGILYLFNGQQSGIEAIKGSTKKDIEIVLLASKSSQIVIKEFYYGGCFNSVTNKNYSNDQYIILYNNSDQPAFLDSLCIGVVYPYNAPTNGKLSDWVKPGTSELRDSIPAASMVWMFPGNGEDNILDPGKEVVLAKNAIDHSKSVPESVNLGKQGYWAIYDPIMTRGHSTPEAGVKLLQGIWKTGSATSYVISIVSPGLFIFTLGNKSVEQFILDNFAFNPNSTNLNLASLLVDKNLVLDGVECFRDQTDTKRFVSEIDNGFAKTPGSGQGYSIIRKVDSEETAKAGGRIVYMDTNNSSNDFEVLDHPTLYNK
ncbi:MAG: DUF4876 domain-containing protein [Petrimonas sp.]|jgi:hypothetical protein